MSEKVITRKIKYCDKCGEPLEMLFPNGPILGMDCQTAHCGRCKPHFDFGDNTFPIVPYRHLPQTLIGMTADCRSLV